MRVLQHSGRSLQILPRHVAAAVAAAACAVAGLDIWNWTPVATATVARPITPRPLAVA